jgi:hypothetical protein
MPDLELTEKQKAAIKILIEFFKENIEGYLEGVEPRVSEYVAAGELEYTELNNMVLDVIDEQIEEATTNFNYYSMCDEDRDLVFQAHYDLGYVDVWKDHHLENQNPNHEESTD